MIWQIPAVLNILIGVWSKTVDTESDQTNLKSTTISEDVMSTKTIKSVTIIASLVALTACGGAQQYDPNMDRTKTKQGAMIGSLIGAVGAYVTSDGSKSNRRGAAIKGAIIGGGLGAAIGNQLDKQAAELRNDLNNDQVVITNTGDRLIVTLPQDILFDVDSTYVAPGLRSDLATLAANLQNYPNSDVQIVGHTDNTGDAAYNVDLSTRRAGAVADVVRANGVDPYRIRTYGAGEDQPLASNLTPEGRAQNRRVELIIVPRNG